MRETLSSEGVLVVQKGINIFEREDFRRRRKI